MPPGVLFLCDAGSARSQLAEALARKRFGDRLRVQSASTRPGSVHPMAIEVLAEDKVSVRGLSSKAVESIDPATVDLAVTLCADEVCPASLASVRRLHWPLRDPVGEGSESELHRRFRLAKRMIAARLDAIEAALATPPGTRILPAGEGARQAADAIALPSLDVGFGRQPAIAWIGDDIVGRAVLDTGRDAAHAVLAEVEVAEPHRRRGIGRALVADRVAFAKSLAVAPHGHGVIASVTAAIGHGAVPGAATFFERCGFTYEGDSLVQRFYVTNQELLARGIAAELAEHGTMVPPFAKYPDIPCMSIGWRMGDGEWYLWMWSTWFNALDDASRAAYLATWEPQAPDDWVGWMDDDPDEDEKTGSDTN